MSESLTSVLTDLKSASSEGETSVGELLDHFNGRSLGAILTLVGAIAALPFIGGIPGVSILTGVMIIVVSTQALFGRGEGLWAPERLKEKTVESDRIAEAVEKAKPYSDKLDALTGKRLSFLVSKPLIAVSAIVLGLTFIPLAIVPWGVLVPAIGVVMLGLSLLGRDGLFALFGYALMLGTFYLIYYVAL